MTKRDIKSTDCYKLSRLCLLLNLPKKPSTKLSAHTRRKESSGDCSQNEDPKVLSKSPSLSILCTPHNYWTGVPSCEELDVPVKQQALSHSIDQTIFDHPCWFRLWTLIPSPWLSPLHAITHAGRLSQNPVAILCTFSYVYIEPCSYISNCTLST